MSERNKEKNSSNKGTIIRKQNPVSTEVCKSGQRNHHGKAEYLKQRVYQYVRQGISFAKSFVWSILLLYIGKSGKKLFQSDRNVDCDESSQERAGVEEKQIFLEAMAKRNHGKRKGMKVTKIQFIRHIIRHNSFITSILGGSVLGKEGVLGRSFWR